MPEQRKGFTYGFAAYLIWGLFPLYWKLLDHSGAIELLAHRVLWSLVTIAILVVVLRKFGQVKALLREPRRRWPLIAAAFLISANWGTYIWAVNHGRVVETSLGYFITPLFTVLLGVFVLKERLRTAQWIALAIAFVAVVGLTDRERAAAVGGDHPDVLVRVLRAGEEAGRRRGDRGDGDRVRHRGPARARGDRRTRPPRRFDGHPPGRRLPGAGVADRPDHRRTAPALRSRRDAGLDDDARAC